MKSKSGMGMKFFGLMLIIMYFCCNLDLLGAEPDDLYVFDRSKIRIEGDLSPFESILEIKELGLQKYVVNVSLHSASAAKLPSFNVSVRFPKERINQLWNSQTWSNKSSFEIPSYDRAAAGFSVISGLTINDQNQITFTCRDAYHARFVSSNIREENDSVVFNLGFFEDYPSLLELHDYHAEVLVDCRNIHFSKAIYDASSWFLADEFKQGVASVDTTNVPVFSTWYPMHRNIPIENITKEMDSLKSFNFKSVLVDDGWQALVKMTIDTACFYNENNDKSMTLFRQKCHEMGLPLYLWYSLPFMGGNPVVLTKFEGKYIRYQAPSQMYVLDPRYAEVRKHLVGTYANFLSDWQFDGYRFDFLKGFYPKEGAVINQDNGRDFVSVGLAADSLYAELELRLKTINPNVFMGQKFQVVGPGMASNPNFLTGFVGAENTQVVREKMVNNRLLYGKYTPFMEVVAINQRDKVEEIARKMQSVMFGNLYLSFTVSTLSQDSRQTIRFWLDYWKKNYKVLFEGNFEPMQVSRYYPAIKVENEQKTIYVLYEDYFITLPIVLRAPIEVVNSKATDDIHFLLSDPETRYNYELFNCKGESTGKGVLKSKNQKSIDFSVPVAGVIRITPIR